MAETKWIPGPYAVDSVVSDDDFDIILGYDVPGAGTPILIGTVLHADDDADSRTITRKQSLATARLWAAAPTMADAIRHYLRWADEVGETGPRVDRLAAALKLAEKGE